MTQNHKMYCKSTVLTVLLFSLLFISGFSVLATSVDRMSIVNLEGFPGETIKQEITLEGASPEERFGFWYTHYKEIEGDDDRMDITGWITIEPEEYSIKEGEIKTFIVEVKIPRNAKPGLYGATSEEAGREGHSEERRTYIVFKDALEDANVYSGLLIPLSINVLPSPNPLAPVINFVMQNILVIALIAVIVVMVIIMAILLLKKRKQAKER